MNSHTRHPGNNAGQPIAHTGTRQKPEVITAAGLRTSSKLATHSSGSTARR